MYCAKDKQQQQIRKHIWPNDTETNDAQSFKSFVFIGLQIPSHVSAWNLLWKSQHPSAVQGWEMWTHYSLKHLTANSIKSLPNQHNKLSEIPLTKNFYRNLILYCKMQRWEDYFQSLKYWFEKKYYKSSKEIFIEWIRYVCVILISNPM